MSTSSRASGGGSGGGYTTESFTVKIEGEGVKLRTKLFRPAGGGSSNEEVMVLVYRHITRIMLSSQEELRQLASGLAQRGYRAVTFDMRGIRRSTGEPSLTGSDEVKDVVAVCKWVRGNLPNSDRMVLVGCSAGAAIAGSALDSIKEAVASVSISYPFGFMSSYLIGRHYAAILNSTKLRLFIMGKQDWFTTHKQLKNKLSSSKSSNFEEHVIPQGSGHCPIQNETFVSKVVEYIVDTFIPKAPRSS